MPADSICIDHNMRFELQLLLAAIATASPVPGIVLEPLHGIGPLVPRLDPNTPPNGVLRAGAIGTAVGNRVAAFNNGVRSSVQQMRVANGRPATIAEGIAQAKQVINAQPPPQQVVQQVQQVQQDQVATQQQQQVQQQQQQQIPQQVLVAQQQVPLQQLQQQTVPVATARPALLRVRPAGSIVTEIR